MDVNLSINFYGKTEEALNFYTEALGAKTLYLLRFHDGPQADTISDQLRNKVLHATFSVGNTQLMASDVGCDTEAPKAKASHLSLAIRLDDARSAQRCYSALQRGGTVLVPLGETDFAIRYGIVQDKFGISWKIIAQRESVSTP